MKDASKTLLNKIASTLGDLVESILKKEAPFDAIPVYREVVSSTYIKYLQFFDEIEQPLRGKILRSEIDRAKFQIIEGIAGVDTSFAIKYPQHMETRNKFWDWLEANRKSDEDSIINIQGKIQEEVDIAKLAKQKVKERIPDFVYKKNKKFKGVLCFEKSWLKDNKIYFLIDKGTKRKFFDVFIGLDNPSFVIDIASFFSGSQSTFWYMNTRDAEENMQKCIDIFRMILSFFEKRVYEILSSEREIRDVPNI